jgi:hypothetical protein
MRASIDQEHAVSISATSAFPRPALVVTSTIDTGPELFVINFGWVRP